MVIFLLDNHYELITVNIFTIWINNSYGLEDKDETHQHTLQHNNNITVNNNKTPRKTTTNIKAK